MSQFDPYLKWLGIRETARPVNHYRLLGLELYESDKDVISMSADRQMAHIRTFQSGPNGKLSQQILNELARARRCLLVEEKKAAYDQQLKASLGASSGRSESLAGAQGTESRPISAQAVSQAAPAAVPPTAAPVPVVEPTVVNSSSGSSNISGQASPGMQLNVRTDPNARQKTKSREKKQLIWALVSWISGGLAAVGVGAFLIGSGILGNVFPDPPVPNPVGPNPVVPDLPAPKPIVVDPPAPKPIVDNPIVDDPIEVDDPTLIADGPSFEMPKVWTLKDLAKYPKPNSAEKLLLFNVIADLSAERVGKLESSAPSTAGTNGVRQKISGLKDPSFLIGMSYVVDSNLKIEKLEPVFRAQSSIVRKNLSGAKSLIARPGYAVGEIQASVLSPMNCVRLRFMKVTNKGLDPDDSYLSSWIGREIGPVRTIANPLNAPIVGTYCDYESNSEIRTLGLIAAHRSMAPTKIEAENAVGSSFGATEKKTIKETPKEATSIVGSSLPVISRTPVASTFFTSGARKDSIVFVNKLDEDVSLYKIDSKLNLRSYARIRAGSSYTIPSEQGENWHVKKGSLSIATFRAELGKNTAVIDGRHPDISGSSRLPEVAGLKKNPVPSSSDKNKALKEVKKVYGVMISEAETKDARDNRRNAEAIIDDARGSSEDLAMQYVMFESAKDIAVIKGDCRTAMLSLRELDRRFDDFDFWGEVVNVVQDSGKSLGRTGDKLMATELDAVLRALIDEAIRGGESRAASKLVAFGKKAASRNGDAQALQFYNAKDRESSEVAKLQKQYENAVVKLAGDPENSNANTQKGRYLIVARGDFGGALECWKFSDDDEVLAIVKAESATDTNASFLARRWRNLGGDTTKTAFGRRCYERAIQVLISAGKSREAKDLQKLLDQ